jgi:hypothetical protein
MTTGTGGGGGTFIGAAGGAEGTAGKLGGIFEFCFVWSNRAIFCNYFTPNFIIKHVLRFGNMVRKTVY